MSTNTMLLQLPEYQTFVDSIAELELPLSASELHGVLCGYLSAGANREGETYIRTLMTNKNDTSTRVAELSLFSIYTVSQQQLSNLGFEFQLLLPNERESLFVRAQAFSEWCEGFTQGITMAGVDYNHLQDEDAQEAIQHLIEFSQLDCQSLQVDDEDERALMEVCEYARMAVLHIHSDLQTSQSEKDGSQTTH